VKRQHNKFYLSEVEKKTIRIIKLKLLVEGYQKAIWQSMVAAYDKYMNNWKLYLQYKHTQHEHRQMKTSSTYQSKQFLSARRYASAGNSDRNVSVCPCVRLSVCLSVRPSVTRRYCVKTKKVSVMIL